MVDGRAREISGPDSGFLGKFQGRSIRRPHSDVFLDLDFLLEQQVAWDYNGCIMHLRRERRVSVSWRNSVTPVILEVDLTIAGLPEGEYGMRVK